MKAGHGAPIDWRKAWIIARRDLTARIRGLRLLFLCLLLGVATLAAIGSLTSAITSELAARGQTLLGGDIEVAMTQREADSAELASLKPIGQISTTIRMRAMAQSVPENGALPKAVLSELKGVDAAYPLYGALKLEQGSDFSSLRSDELVIGRALVDRLGVKVGDRMRFGTASFTIRDIIADEPDRVGEGFTLGPVALTPLAGLRRTGLLMPGSLYETKYRIALPPIADAKAAAQSIRDAHPSAGWEVKDRDNAAPGANRFFERMGQFLSLIGLSALIIAGIGVSNGVSSYLTQKRGSIATLKVLGATSQDIGRIYRLQIGAVAFAAILFGLAIGALLPPVLIAVAGDILPVKPGFALYPIPLMTSAAYGLLIALAFTLAPLARARTQPAAALYRGILESSHRMDRRTIWGIVTCGCGVIAIALVTAREPSFSAAVLGAVGAVLLLLAGIGQAIQAGAKRIPRTHNPLTRLAIASLHRPGAQTGSLVIALGLALTLFVTIAAIQTSLNSEIERVVPTKAPNQFVLDIPRAQQSRFEQSIRTQAPNAQIAVVPALRGTIVAYGQQRVADLPKLPADAWFLRGERGVTYADHLPDGSSLTQGAWWPKGYSGPPLVSVDEKVAQTLGVGIGDTLTVSVLGREITARIASLRQIDWNSMGFNYIMVFTPVTFDKAPHSLAATITIDKAQEEGVSSAVLGAFPSASIISVGEVVGRVSDLLNQMSVAIVAAASIAIFAGIAVLIGAIIAARQSRIYDSVIMKMLGASRAQILGVQILEYGILALVLSFVALALGSLAGWYVITLVFDFGWAPDWSVVAATLFGGAILTLGLGLAGSLPLLSARPAQALRTV